MALAITAARQIWGGAVPCGGNYRVIVGSDPYQSWTGGDVAGWAAFHRPPLPAGPARDAIPPGSDYFDCAIHIETSAWASPAAMLADYPRFCRAIAHEYGHLLGHIHSTVPTSIMYPVLGPQMVAPPCDR